MIWIFSTSPRPSSPRGTARRGPRASPMTNCGSPRPTPSHSEAPQGGETSLSKLIIWKVRCVPRSCSTVSCPTSSAPAALHLRRGTPRPPRGMASTPQRPPPPQRPPGPKSLLLGRPRNRSLRHLRGPEPPTRRLQPILPRKPSRTAAGRAEERRRGRGDRSAAEEAIEHPLVSAVPERPFGEHYGVRHVSDHHVSNSPHLRAIVAR